MSNAKDAVATMGGILPEGAGGRDAVHVAVFSATCKRRIYPNVNVGLVNDIPDKTGDYWVTEDTNEFIGIVDPFLNNAVDFIEPGQRFWVFLYPRTITGLTHHWSHPAFGETGGVYATPSSKMASEQWLKNFCESNDTPGYETVMAAIRGESLKGDISCMIDDEYFLVIGRDAHREIPDEFWVHAENVLGHSISIKPKWFCSC